ncbi:MAG TPA: beta-galactosidase trimerization domain-containing protein [Planctomycetota bacterium]|nr:beta-galactosidase trimerization domain-containing protein [Planctomycetota bacterium]
MGRMGGLEPVWLKTLLGLLVAGIWVCLCAPRLHGQDAVTPEAVKAALEELGAAVKNAQEAGHETLYAEIPLTVGQRFLEKEWDDPKLADRREDWAKFLMRTIRFEKAQLDAMLAGAKNARLVPPIPEYARLKMKDNYFYLDGEPFLVITHRNSGGEKGDTRYCGPGELYGIVSGVGATRYDYQNTPIWKVYQEDPKSHRVYDGGWCGHIIKDKWSIGGQGGRQGVCIISLDYPPMLEAVRQSIVMRCERFKKSARYKQAKILSMDWEFTYQNYDEPSRAKWQNWLKDRYKTAQALNGVWKTDLASFTDVTLPSVNWGREQNPARYYDFSEFNIWRFNEYLFWAREVILKECPDWPMTVGGGSPFGADFAKSGIDEEYMRARGVVDVFLSETGSRSWGTASVFDLQHSMDPKAMIHDPEYHSTGGYVFLMFLHGASSVDFYNWNSRGLQKSLADGTAMLRACLDVRRMPEEIVQFPKASPEAAIFYSRGSLIQRHPGGQKKEGRRGVQTPYSLELEKCYRAGTLLDSPVGFVTTRQAREGIRKDLKVLILPCAYFVNEEAFAKIVNYAAAGGTVLVTPTSLVADEYNRRRDYLKTFGIEITAEAVPQYLAAKAKAGVAQPGSEYDFIQGPIAPTVVSDEPTGTITWKTMKAAPLKGRGIRQSIKVSGPHTVLATLEDGNPALVSRKIGRGEVIYLAMQLEDLSMGDLMDWLYDRAEITRPVRTTDPEGKRIPGLESRTVPYKGGYLTYLYNMNEHSVSVKLRPKVNVGKVTNLSLAQDAKLSDTFEVGPYDWCILKLAR